MIKKILLFVFVTICFIRNDIIAQQAEPVWFPEKYPEYPGGIKELQKFLINNIIYPKEMQEKGIEKTVVIDFIIEEDGSISNINLLGPMVYAFGFGEEALRVINLMPKWEPGQINGKNVRTLFIILVKFSLDNTLAFDIITQKQNLEKFPHSSTDIIDDSTNITLNSDARMDRYYSRILPHYSFPENSSEYRFHFLLYENWHYEIFTAYDDDFIVPHYISIGKYKVENDTIILTDSYYHYQLLFQFDSCLMPVKTYPFMKEMVFKDYYKTDMKNINIDEEIPVEEIVSDFEKTNSQNNHFEEGTYKYERIYKHESFFKSKYELNLNGDKTYELSFKEKEIYPLSLDNQLVLYLVFSTGTWERKGNILMLWDTILQHQFYGLIREDGIKLLFFRWKDMVFKK